jgi:site-specific DNA-methyltransferase (adenine-specific)
MTTNNQLRAGENFTLHLGDNLATLKNYPDNTFDSIVCDPPYGIEFLGKDWDSHTGTIELYKECLRVLKPGGYMLAFSAARTYHQLASNIESAGFEIRDQLMWLYSSGFPKAQDIGKAIDKRENGARDKQRFNKEELTHIDGDRYLHPNGKTYRILPDINGDRLAVSHEGEGYGSVFEEVREITSEWNGFKTALKPAHEPIVMARKPFKGSTIDNVLKNGLGAMNIDATRIEWEGEPVTSTTIGTKATFTNFSAENLDKDKHMDEQWVGNTQGRYPSNVIGEVEEGYQKYFYNPKVSRKERHVGFEDGETTIEALESIGGKRLSADTCFIPGLGDIKIHGAKHEVQKIRSANGQGNPDGNNHPTVKPVALMDYLIKLVTPPSTPTLQRKVLDPFMGSGSTGMAAVALGHHFTGCELDPKYVAIAATRIEAWNKPDDSEPQLPEELFGT